MFFVPPLDTNILGVPRTTNELGRKKQEKKTIHSPFEECLIAQSPKIFKKGKKGNVGATTIRYA